MRLILGLLDTAKVVEDMNAPGLVLHPLKGNKKGLGRDGAGELADHVRFVDGDAEVVDYLDYH